MAFFNLKIVKFAFSSIEKELAWYKENNTPAHFRLKRWSQRIGSFVTDISKGLKSIYSLNDNFEYSYRTLINELIINALRESDFTLLMCFEYLEAKTARGERPTQKPFVKIEDMFVDYLRENRNKPDFVKTVLDFQQKQIKFFDWYYALPQPHIKMKDIPMEYRHIARIVKLRDQFLNEPIEVKVSLDLADEEMILTITNKSFLNEEQIERIIRHVEQSIAPVQEVEMNQEQGGHGLGGLVIKSALFDVQGLHADAKNIPIIYLPDKTHNQVSVTLTLDKKTLEGLKAIP